MWFASGKTRSPSKRANDHWSRGIVWAGHSRLLHRQRGVAVVQVLGRVGPMQAIREELDMDVGIGLEGHRDLP